MKRVRKVFIAVGSVLLVLVVIAGSAGVWFVRRPWPQVNGTLAVAGLSAPVEIIRDRWGVPHIYAQNERDLFFAQGYAHAQDRLWQLMFNQRVGRGTLSAVFGEATLGIDRLTRTIGMRRAAEKDWAMLDDETRAILEAYADGINAYVAMHRDRLPIEFTLTNMAPTDWTPIDTLTWGKLMGWQLAGDFGVDLLRARAVAALGAPMAEDILPFAPQGAQIPPEAQNYSWLKESQAPQKTSAAFTFDRPNLYHGSNSWVLAGERTASGKPLLAVDTHLALNMPSIWYANGLHGGRFSSVGYTMPGVPAVIHGQNQRIAWGVTNLSSDVQDLFIEKLDNPDQPTQYEFKGEWRDLQVIPETIEINGSEPLQLRILNTHHGPIINELFSELKEAEPIAMQWPDLEGTMLIKSIVQINLASNWETFRAALRYWGAPKENLVYADVDGNIGYQAVGSLPLRTPENQGTLPLPGWTGAYDWQGYIAFEELPSIYNPPEGYIIAANSRVVPPDSSPYRLEFFGMAYYRAQQIKSSLQNETKIDAEATQRLQADTFSPAAEELRPYMIAVQPANERQQRSIDIVRDWDLTYETDRVGASVYEVWRWFLERSVVGDELGEDILFEYQRYGLATSPKLATLMVQPDNLWFDDRTTPERETRDDITLRALDTALDWLSERYGTDPNGWQWGRLHTMTFVHQPLGQSGIAALEQIFNSKAIPAPGGDYTVNNGWFSALEPFVMEGGTSQRLIIDFNNLENTLAVNSTGQSGHVFHPHRDRMIEMWQNMEYHPMRFSRESVEQVREGTLTLNPQ